MTLAQLLSLGQLLTAFLSRFADCFAGCSGRALLRLFVRGLLSNVQRKNIEALALEVQAPVRTLQRFLESIKWNEQQLVDRCQQLVATEHADPQAIGLIDETGVAKSGRHTAGAQRQYNGNRGKIENAVVHVGLGYSTGDFHALLDARVFLPQAWADDPARRKKLISPPKFAFRPSPRSRSSSSPARSATACGCAPGHLTSCTVAADRFSTAWKRSGRPSSARSRQTFTCGWTRRASCTTGRRLPVRRGGYA